MNVENEEPQGEHFQSASEEEFEGSDGDFHSPVSQQRTEASDSPSPRPKNSSLLQSDVGSQPGECPAGVSPAEVHEPEMDLDTAQARTAQEELSPSAEGPTTDACEPVEAVSDEAVADAVEDGPDPAVLLAEAEELKSRGNDLFKQEQHVEAIEEYDKALDVAPPDAIQRAIYHANKAACHLALEGYKECIDCCSAALTVNPDYLKALRRRMTAHEKLDELENALADAKRIVELDPGDSKTAQSIAKWTPLVAERQEKMKEEVMGKLKDLGNSVLGNFGMSLDNFKMDKDPNTGGYSIRFEQ